MYLKLLLFLSIKTDQSMPVLIIGKSTTDIMEVTTAILFDKEGIQPGNHYPSSVRWGTSCMFYQFQD